jgi:hypothetical protein
MNFSSLWMLSHVLRIIKAGWGFQLNADVTGQVCRKSVDLLAFSVTSIPKRNNTLCLCIIPTATESERAYACAYEELCKAVCLLPSIKHCSKEDCHICGMLAQLLEDSHVSEFVRSPKFGECKLPVQTAMCDNFKGWGNFAEKSLGLTANICHTHATGNVSGFSSFAMQLTLHVLQVSRHQRARMSSTFLLPLHMTTITTLWSTSV